MGLLRGVAVSLGLLLCAGCGAHGWSMAPRPLDAASLSYAEIVRLHDSPRLGEARRIGGHRLAAPMSHARPQTPVLEITSAPETTLVAAGPPVGGAFAAFAPPGPSDEDPGERYVCADGVALEVRFAADRSEATARRTDGDPVTLLRAASAGPPTYTNGAATLRRAGPRLVWAEAGGDAERSIVVQPGDTLSGIALERLGSIDQVAALVAANPDLIEDPDLIFPGQVLLLPGTAAAGTSCLRLPTGRA